MKNIFEKIKYYFETKRLFKGLDLNHTNFAILDTETTGLDVRNEKIISLASLKIKQLQIKETEFINFLVNPEKNIPDSSIEIHKIKNEDVNDKPTFLSKSKEVLMFLKKNILVGHNINFDINFIKKDARGTKLETRMKVIKSVDTIYLAAALFPDLKSYELSHLCEKFNIKKDDQIRHSALGDCWLTGRLFLYLIEHAKNQGVQNVNQLLNLCERGKNIKIFSNAH